jgi:thioredoxin 1
MAACCIGGVCIPYTAILPVLALGFHWIASKLAALGLLPESVAQRLGVSNNGNHQTPKCCENETTTDCTRITTDKKAFRKTSSTTQGVTVMASEKEWEECLSSSMIVVVKFTAEWCKPCKAISPFYHQLSLQHSDSASFVEVDVDELDDVAASAGIAMMPTFAVFRNSRKIDSMSGANEEKLKTFVQQHCSS